MKKVVVALGCSLTMLLGCTTTPPVSQQVEEVSMIPSQQSSSAKVLSENGLSVVVLPSRGKERVMLAFHTPLSQGFRVQQLSEVPVASLRLSLTRGAEDYSFELPVVSNVVSFGIEADLGDELLLGIEALDGQGGVLGSVDPLTIFAFPDLDPIRFPLELSVGSTVEKEQVTIPFEVELLLPPAEETSHEVRVLPGSVGETTGYSSGDTTSSGGSYSSGDPSLGGTYGDGDSFDVDDLFDDLTDGMTDGNQTGTSSGGYSSGDSLDDTEGEDVLILVHGTGTHTHEVLSMDPNTLGVHRLYDGGTTLRAARLDATGKELLVVQEGANSEILRFPLLENGQKLGAYSLLQVPRYLQDGVAPGQPTQGIWDLQQLPSGDFVYLAHNPFVSSARVVFTSDASLSAAEIVNDMRTLGYELDVQGNTAVYASLYQDRSYQFHMIDLLTRQTRLFSVPARDRSALFPRLNYNGTLVAYIEDQLRIKDVETGEMLPVSPPETPLREQALCMSPRENKVIIFTHDGPLYEYDLLTDTYTQKGSFPYSDYPVYECEWTTL